MKQPERVYIARASGVVFVYLPNNDATPYVTWVEDPNTKETYWGHYHRDFGAAVEDYRGRAMFDEGLEIHSIAFPPVSIADKPNQSAIR